MYVTGLCSVKHDGPKLNVMMNTHMYMYHMVFKLGFEACIVFVSDTIAPVIENSSTSSIDLDRSSVRIL